MKMEDSASNNSEDIIRRIKSRPIIAIPSQNDNTDSD